MIAASTYLPGTSSSTMAASSIQGNHFHDMALPRSKLADPSRRVPSPCRQLARVARLLQGAPTQALHPARAPRATRMSTSAARVLTHVSTHVRNTPLFRHS